MPNSPQRRFQVGIRCFGGGRRRWRGSVTRKHSRDRVVSLFRLRRYCKGDILLLHPKMQRQDSHLTINQSLYRPSLSRKSRPRLHQPNRHITLDSCIDLYLDFQIQLDLDLQTAVLLADLGRPVCDARLVHGYHAAAASPPGHHMRLGGVAEAIFVFVVILVGLLLLGPFLEGALVFLADLPRLLAGGGGAAGAFGCGVVGWEVGDGGSRGEC